jgi:hypothetical protein
MRLSINLGIADFVWNLNTLSEEPEFIHDQNANLFVNGGKEDKNLYNSKYTLSRFDFRLNGWIFYWTIQFVS